MINRLGCPRRKTIVILLAGIPALLLFYLSQNSTYQRLQPHHEFKLKIVQWNQENVPIDNSRIYFHETSGSDHLSVRQCCAVESAARNNPTRPVQIFLQGNSLNYSSHFLSVLEHYSNVAVILLNETEYFTNTPLEKWYKTERK